MANLVEWIPTTTSKAAILSDKAVIGGYEDRDHSDLWIIRAHLYGDLIPGKLAIKRQDAYIAYHGKEYMVKEIEVLCCSQQNKLKWVESSEGSKPAGAIQGGYTSAGETLYIGRATYNESLMPGKLHPSHKSLYVSYAGKEISYDDYEILVAK